MFRYGEYLNEMHEFVASCIKETIYIHKTQYMSDVENLETATCFGL